MVELSELLGGGVELVFNLARVAVFLQQSNLRLVKCFPTQKNSVCNFKQSNLLLLGHPRSLRLLVLMLSFVELGFDLLVGLRQFSEPGLQLVKFGSGVLLQLLVDLGLLVKQVLLVRKLLVCECLLVFQLGLPLIRHIVHLRLKLSFF